MNYTAVNLIEFDEPFLDFYNRCNSKTYYHLLLVAKYDLPMLVHSQEYRKNLIRECMHRFKIKNAPIFCITNQNEYNNQIHGTKYRNKKFIIDDVIAFKKYDYFIVAYSPEEVRDLVLTYLSDNVTESEVLE